MIDIFSDKLFRMELGRLASEQVVTRRVATHNEFRRLMVKLKEAAPREVKSPIAGTSYIAIASSRVPGANPHKLCTCDDKSQCTCREFETMRFKLVGAAREESDELDKMRQSLARMPEQVKRDAYNEIYEWLAKAQPLIMSRSISQHDFDKLKKWRSLFKAILAEEVPILKLKETRDERMNKVLDMVSEINKLLELKDKVLWSFTTTWDPVKQEWVKTWTKPKPFGRLA